MIDKRILRAGVLKKKKKEPYQCSNNEFNFHFTVSPSLFFLIFLPNSPDASKTLFAIFVQLTNCRGGKKKKKNGKKLLRPSIELGTTVSRFTANIRACAKFVNRFSNGPCTTAFPEKSSRSTELYFFCHVFADRYAKRFLLSNPSKRSNTTNHDRSAVQNRFDLLDHDKKRKKGRKKRTSPINATLEELFVIWNV